AAAGRLDVVPARRGVVDERGDRAATLGVEDLLTGAARAPFDERDLPGERTRRERARVPGRRAAECAPVSGDVLGGYHLRRPERRGELRPEVGRPDREPGEVGRYRCGRGDVDLAGYDRRVLGDRAG